jgi:hypothetical protein
MKLNTMALAFLVFAGCGAGGKAEAVREEMSRWSKTMVVSAQEIRTDTPGRWYEVDLWDEAAGVHSRLLWVYDRDNSTMTLLSQVRDPARKGVTTMRGVER